MNQVQTDIQEIIEKKELFDSLRDSVVLITGATGLIGSMMIKTILAANEQYGLGITVIGQIRNPDKARKIFAEKFHEIKFVTFPEVFCNYIVHTVSPTNSRFFIEHPVETIEISVKSTMEVLEAARKSNASVVYLSSMEQYGVPYGPVLQMTEDKAGIIDHLNVRSSYSESKRLCECLCASYADEYGVDVKIARLAQTFGAGISTEDNRLPVQLARAALKGEDIVLHTEGKSTGNFVYLSDALTGILTILEKGTLGQAYNVCNDRETRSVLETAQLVANVICGGKIRVQIEKRENMGYAPDVHMYLKSDKLRMLGWNSYVDLTEAYRRMISYLRGE